MGDHNSFDRKEEQDTRRRRSNGFLIRERGPQEYPMKSLSMLSGGREKDEPLTLGTSQTLASTAAQSVQ